LFSVATLPKFPFVLQDAEVADRASLDPALLNVTVASETDWVSPLLAHAEQIVEASSCSENVIVAVSPVLASPGVPLLVKVTFRGEGSTVSGTNGNTALVAEPWVASAQY
jgi:hypothetical protein